MDPDLRAAWEVAAQECLKEESVPKRPALTDIPVQFLILVTCRDERHQVELLGRFLAEGLECRALLS